VIDINSEFIALWFVDYLIPMEQWCRRANENESHAISRSDSGCSCR